MGAFYVAYPQRGIVHPRPGTLRYTGYSLLGLTLQSAQALQCIGYEGALLVHCGLYHPQRCHVSICAFCCLHLLGAFWAVTGKVDCWYVSDNLVGTRLLWISAFLCLGLFQSLYVNSRYSVSQVFCSLATL